MKWGGGWLMPVVGPSGAGKDSLIRAAQLHYREDSGIVFPRRVVTREAVAAAEDHDHLNEVGFALAVAKGEFALWWGAHGNAYGIPVSINDDIVAGRTVVFNCSREILADVARSYCNVHLLDVTAPEDILVNRIVARGRETREEALKRVSRKPRYDGLDMDIIQINNGGDLADAAAAFIAAIASPSQELRADPGRRPLNSHDQKENRDDGGGGLVVVEHLK
jgi:ribose 1,5-bisphosphokinase